MVNLLLYMLDYQYVSNVQNLLRCQNLTTLPISAWARVKTQSKIHYTKPKKGASSCQHTTLDVGVSNPTRNPTNPPEPEPTTARTNHSEGQ